MNQFVSFITDKRYSISVFSFSTTDFILSGGPSSITIISDKKPEKVLLQPDGRPLDFTYADGRITVLVDRLDIHGLLDIAY